MFSIYHALEELDQKREVGVRLPLSKKGSGRSTHMNIGTMRAGDWPAMVTGNAVIGCRIGYAPRGKKDDNKPTPSQAVSDDVELIGRASGNDAASHRISKWWGLAPDQKLATFTKLTNL
jgi:hypothetical protein